MHTHLAWLRPLRQAVRHALAQLHHSLVRITVRVRETVVEAIAQAAAEIVRQASAPLLPVAEEFAREPVRRPHDSSLIWDDDRQRQEYGYDGYEDQSDNWDHYEPQDEPEAAPTAPSRLQVALAAGCRVTAWLLSRGGSLTVARALGAGALTALAAFSGSPLVAAGVGIIGSLATWLSLNAG
jgi:hypothetical protein